MERTLRVSDIAKRMGVNQTTVVYWIKKGHFPRARKLGPAINSPYIVPESDVIALEEKLRARPPTQD